MVALTVAALAVIGEASTVAWSSASAAYGVTTANVLDNGPYTAGGQKMRSGGVFNWALTVFDEDGNKVGTGANGTITGTTGTGSTGKIAINGVDIGGTLVQDANYTFEIVITGKQTSLSNKEAIEKDGYKYTYTDATLSTTLTGAFTGKGSGDSLISAGPSSWTVSGIKVEAVPEPTSGLLLLLGVAGLALRRRRA